MKITPLQVQMHRASFCSINDKNIFSHSLLDLTLTDGKSRLHLHDGMYKVEEKGTGTCLYRKGELEKASGR